MASLEIEAEQNVLPREHSSPRTTCPLDLAAAFACAVTKQTKNIVDVVARKGDHSLFNLFRSILPDLCHLGSRRKPVKGKIARTEFNKMLQSKCGFICSRSRKRCLREAGNWLFSHRRLLDPRNPKDMLRVERAFSALCCDFPALQSTTKDHFMSCLSDAAMSWSNEIQCKDGCRGGSSQKALECEPRSESQMSKAGDASLLVGTLAASHAVVRGISDEKRKSHLASSCADNAQCPTLRHNLRRESPIISDNYIMEWQHHDWMDVRNVGHSRTLRSGPSKPCNALSELLEAPGRSIKRLNAGQLVDLLLMDLDAFDGVLDLAEIERFQDFNLT